ncbi:hypothetical protein GCM10022231_36440 [Gordonia caeni]|uniref:Uncharacterized protein n=1 Tax=Gordonia caeni TaxID=1007097 RepID=A0ABP7PUW9_9ACTN
MGHLLRAQDPRQLAAAIDAGRHHDEGRPGGEGHQQLQDGGIEARGRELQGPGSRAEAVAPVLFEREGGQTAVGDHHALGFSGGSGRVDHVCGIVHAQRPRPVGIGHGLRRGGAELGAQCRSVERDPVPLAVTVVAEAVSAARAGHAESGTAVVEQIGDPLVGQFRVHGDEGAAGHQDRQLGDYLGTTARQQRRHQVARADAAGDQDPRQPVDPVPELVVPEVDVVGHQCDGARVRPRDGRQQIRQRLRRSRSGSPRRDVTQAIAVGENLEAVDERLRRTADERGQHRAEPPVVGAQVVGGVGGRVGLQVDPQPPAAGVDGEGQVFGGAGAEDGAAPGALAKRQFVPEHHHVDHRAEEAAAGRPVGVLIAAHVLEAVPLVAQSAAELGGDLSDQVGDRDAGPHAAADRHHVRDHAARAAKQGVGAAGDRQTEHHVVGSGHPGDVDCGRRTHHRGHRRAVAGAEGIDVGLQLRVERGARAPRPGDPPGRIGQPCGLRECTQPLRPVLPVALEAGRPPVALVVGVQFGQGSGAAGRHRSTGRAGRVDLGDPVGEGGRAVAVEQDVVYAGVPEVTVVAQPQRHRLDQPIGEEVQGALEVGVHPLARRGLRVVVITEVVMVHPVVCGVVEQLDRRLRRIVPRQEPHHGAAELPDHLSCHVREQLGVERTADVDVVRDHQRCLRRQLLCEPDAALGSRQREHLSRRFGANNVQRHGLSTSARRASIHR